MPRLWNAPAVALALGRTIETRGASLRRVYVSGPDELRREVDRAFARLALYEEVLRNIALGYENAGRGEPISVQMYAAQALGFRSPEEIPRP